VETTAGTLHAPRVTLANGPAGQTELLRLAFGQKVAPPGKPTDSHVVLARVFSTQLSQFPLGSGALVSGHRHDSIRATTHLNAKWDYVGNLVAANHHMIRFSTHPPKGDQHDVATIVSSGLSELYRVDDAQILDAVRLSWPGSLLSPQKGHHKWVRENSPAWEAQGLTLRGALVTGNGLLGITNSNRKRQKA
jgi:protoporphyrinogen/coproporphyrinogen III oxidase